jgi:cytochrome P450
MLAAIDFALATSTLLLTVRILRSYYRLSHIPGPFWARFTDLWRHKVQNQPGHSARFVELHRQYGKLVRLGPNHVSISDPGAIPVVYSTNPTWRKGESYYGAVPVSGKRAVPSIIAMNEVQHTAVRKSVGRAFTTNSLLDYEDAIETTGRDLIDALEKTPEADIGQWLQFFAMDMLIRIAFSDSLGLLAKGDDIDGTLAAVMARFDHWDLDRVVPAGGATISGVFIPEGTVVGCQIDAVHLDEGVYGEDSTVFRPERWLEASEEGRRQMSRSFLAFSAGKRVCTGIHIAWLEMKKTLPSLLLNFDVSTPCPCFGSHRCI